MRDTPHPCPVSINAHDVFIGIIRSFEYFERLARLDFFETCFDEFLSRVVERIFGEVQGGGLVRRLECARNVCKDDFPEEQPKERGHDSAFAVKSGTIAVPLA